MIYNADAVKWANEYDGPLHHAMLLGFAKVREVSPFSVHVATVAEGNEVGQIVSRNSVREIRKASDVVNVQFLAVIDFFHAAILTGEAIAFSALSALFGPRRAIVPIITAAPRRIACSAKTDCRAFHRTESPLMFYADLLPWTPDNNFANFAGPFNPFNAVRSWLTSGDIRRRRAFAGLECLVLYKPHCSRFVQARHRTNRRPFTLSKAAWVSLKITLADGTV